MTSSASFEIHEYGNGSTNEIVALVPGLGGSRKDLDVAAQDFAARDKDVVLYEHHPGVLLDGNPYELPHLIDEISDDFVERSLGYHASRVCGVSLGGVITAGVQKNLQNPERGLMASTGGNLAKIVHDNQWFRALVLAMHHQDIQKAYRDYSTEDLTKIWAELHEAPLTPVTLAIGSLDRIVRKRDVLRNVAAWHEYNANIRLIEIPYGTHKSVIKDFNNKVVNLALGKNTFEQSKTQRIPALPVRRIVLT